MATPQALTLSEVIARLPAALDTLGACLLDTEGIYPNGPRIRFLVVAPPGWRPMPPVVDVVGALWYAQTGQLVSLLEGVQAAMGLGLGVDDALTLVHASDEAVGPGAGPVGAARELLIAVIEGWRSHGQTNQHG